jgi:hypothetical protein
MQYITNKIVGTKEYRIYRNGANKQLFDVYKVWGTINASDDPDDWEYDYVVEAQAMTYENAVSFIQAKEGN